ncbi:MAG: DUF4097 family beta strand repeat-containing protein [Candidatus Krumholzibacteriia bacterium]
MTILHDHRRCPLPVVLAGVLLIAATAAAQEKVDRTLAAAADGTVIIENLGGEVMVTGWDRDEVHLTGTLDDQVEELVFERDGDRVRIKVEYPRRSTRIEGSYLQVQVPRGSRLDVRTVSAEVGVRDVRGRIEAQTVSGDVEVAGEPAEVEVQTVSGDVDVTARSPRVRVQSVSGDLHLDGARGDVSAETVSGEITLVGGGFDRLETSSVSGDLEFRGELNRGGTFIFDSHSGDVVLVLGGDLNAEFQVETFSGDIENVFGAKTQRRSKFAPGRELEFTVGDGDARVRVKSFSGDVHLKRR